jgi:hypothetical protein
MRRSALTVSILVSVMTLGACDDRAVPGLEDPHLTEANRLPERSLPGDGMVRAEDLATASLSAAPALASSVCGAATTTTLLAGQHVDAGGVTVANDGEKLYVTYRTADDWSLVRTHLAVAVDARSIPTNPEGTPQVGRFRHRLAHEPSTIEYTYVLTLDDLGLETGHDVFVAAHADLEHPTADPEGAWAEGQPFVPQGTWATYFSHVIQDCGEAEGDLRDFILFATNRFVDAAESTWLDDRTEADAYCATYAASEGIAGSDFRIVYSTPDEDARDFLAYDAARGDRVFDREGTQIGGADLWDGGAIALPDLLSWTVTSTGPDGTFRECSGSYPSGSWPICQYCDRKFACADATDNPLAPGACCWSGTRAILCMAEI